MERIHYKKCTDKKTRTNIRISKQTKKNTKKKYITKKYQKKYPIQENIILNELFMIY